MRSNYVNTISYGRVGEGFNTKIHVINYYRSAFPVAITKEALEGILRVSLVDFNGRRLYLNEYRLDPDTSMDIDLADYVDSFEGRVSLQLATNGNVPRLSGGDRKIATSFFSSHYRDSKLISTNHELFPESDSKCKSSHWRAALPDLPSSGVEIVLLDNRARAHETDHESRAQINTYDDEGALRASLRVKLPHMGGMRVPISSLVNRGQQSILRHSSYRSIEVVGVDIEQPITIINWEESTCIHHF